MPAQPTNRATKEWLYHRNMVGLLPCWAHLIKTGIADRYDWVVNAELDHHISPARVRTTINSYMDILKAGSSTEQRHAAGPLMLGFGNAFLFNRALLQLMRERLDMVGRSAAAGPNYGAGCPEWGRDKGEWPLFCSQDVLYPVLAQTLNIQAYGAFGCGQADKVNEKGTLFPLACWEMSGTFWNPFGESEPGELQAIKTLAAVQDMQSEHDVESYLRSFGDPQLLLHAHHFFIARQVPFIHHIQFASVHRLARALLSP